MSPCCRQNSFEAPAQSEATNDGRALLEALQRVRWTVAGILRKHPNDIEDILQEAALIAIRSAQGSVGGFRGDSAFNTWFYRVAVNRALMHLRPKSRQAAHMQEDFESFTSETGNPEQLAILQERSTRLLEAIADLSPKCQIAALDWLNEEPVGNNVGKSRRHHAKVALRERLGALQ
jgi:RNA polymerase sigma factor (sigma-70 family)